MAKFLIINADDFGMAPGVNKAIIKLYRTGVVTSTSIMVNMPGFSDAVRRWHFTRDLGIGLHFNLSSGYPISPPDLVPSLVTNDGSFGEQKNWKEKDVRIELIAQMKHLRSHGIIPTHIDSHGFIQTLEIVYRPMVLMALRMKIPMRRTGWEPSLKRLRPPLGVDNFYSDTYFEGDGKKLLLDNLQSVPDGTSELLCHPGYVDKYLESVCTWTKVREIELSVLLDPEVLATIRAQNIRLINYKYLRKAININSRFEE